jgi:hypothetical protein
MITSETGAFGRGARIKTSSTQQQQPQQSLPVPSTPVVSSQANAAKEETSSFDALEQELSQKIPGAIETKNSAFIAERDLVSSIAAEEVAALEKIIDPLERISQIADSLKIDIKINGLDSLDENFANKLTELNTTISQLDPEKFSAVGDFFKGLKGFKNVEDNFAKLAEGMTKFGEVINGGLFSGDTVSNIAEIITKISDASKVVGDLSNIVKNGVPRYSYAKDAETNQQVKDVLSDYRYLESPSNFAKGEKLYKQRELFDKTKESKYALTPEETLWLDDYLAKLTNVEAKTNELTASTKVFAKTQEEL